MEIKGKWKKYNNETLYLPDGTEFTPEMMQSYYPASVAEDMAVNVIELVMLEAKPVSYVRAEYMIPSGISDEEAFKRMEQIDRENATKSSPLERIAASLEYLCMMKSQEVSNESTKN